MVIVRLYYMEFQEKNQLSSPLIFPFAFFPLIFTFFVKSV